MNERRFALADSILTGPDGGSHASVATPLVSSLASDLRSSVAVSTSSGVRAGESLRRFHRCWALDQGCEKSAFDVDTYFDRIDQRAASANAMAIRIGYPGPSFEIVYWGDSMGRAFGADLTGVDVADPGLAAFGGLLRPRLLAAIVGGEAIGLCGAVADGDDAETAGDLSFQLLIVPILDLENRTSHLVGMVEFGGNDGAAMMTSGRRFRADWSTATFDATDELIDPEVAVF